MVTRTFITKSNTMVEGSSDNFGLNPICGLHYGRGISRSIVYFNESKIREMIDNGTYADRSLLRHTLRMTNCGSLDPRKFWEKVPPQNVMEQMNRATSFKLIFFAVPKEWDAGVGFDNSLDFWFIGKNADSNEGSSWFYSKSGVAWGKDSDSFSSGNLRTGGGIYSTATLAEQYDKFKNGEESIVIAEQDFDYGNEDMAVDITGFVNDIIDGKKKNYGIGIAFAPYLEKLPRREVQYVGFFNNNTNTFFRPVVETRYGGRVSDDRYTFVAGLKNRLYYDFGQKLDQLPTCEVNGQNWPVKKVSEGVYYAEVKLPKNDYPNEQILYDTWSNIVADGEELEDCEDEFVVHPSGYKGIPSLSKVEPVISGINDDEKIYQGDRRYVTVNFMIKYESSEYALSDSAQYRLYVLDGDAEVTVIDWDDINKMGKDNYFILDTAELVPQNYRIDVKAKENNEIRIFKDVVRFRLVDIRDECRK